MHRSLHVNYKLFHINFNKENHHRVVETINFSDSDCAAPNSENDSVNSSSRRSQLNAGFLLTVSCFQCFHHQLTAFISSSLMAQSGTNSTPLPISIHRESQLEYPHKFMALPPVLLLLCYFNATASITHRISSPPASQRCCPSCE